MLTKPIMDPMHRHDLVWLKLNAVQHAQYLGPAPMELPPALSLLHRWVLGNYPLIVARQHDVPAGFLRVGLAEPAAWGKRRLSYLVKSSDIEQHQQGPNLARVFHELPQPWQAGATALHAFLEEQKIAACVYGSTAVQALTALPCITANSDLDILFKPRSWVAVNALCVQLHALQTSHPEFKVDGEVLSPAGFAVQWQELFQMLKTFDQLPNKLLAKSNTSVFLIDLHQYKQGFECAVRSAA